MTIRPLTVLAALSIALMIYTICFGMLLHRMSKMIQGPSSASPPNLITLFGYPVSDSTILVISSAAPILQLLETVSRWYLRRRRMQAGLCTVCGESLDQQKRRCPNCIASCRRRSNSTLQLAADFWRGELRR